MITHFVAFINEYKLFSTVYCFKEFSVNGNRLKIKQKPSFESVYCNLRDQKNTNGIRNWSHILNLMTSFKFLFVRLPVMAVLSILHHVCFGH